MEPSELFLGLQVIILRIHRVLFGKQECEIGRVFETLTFSVSTETNQKRKKYEGRNRHHMVPKFRGGRMGYNLILLHEKRHDALHKLFYLMTMEEIIYFLRTKDLTGIRKEYLISEMKNRKKPFDANNNQHWEIVFGNRNTVQAADLLERALRIKKFQQSKAQLETQEVKVANWNPELIAA